MKHRRITALALAALLALSATFTVSAQGTQQEKMKQCNIEANARHLAGNERRQYMKVCLSAAGKPHKALNAQQQRMKFCNAQANVKGLKGAERKQFMSSCLKSR